MTGTGSKKAKNPRALGKSESPGKKLVVKSGGGHGGVGNQLLHQDVLQDIGLDVVLTVVGDVAAGVVGAEEIIDKISGG